MYEQYRFQHKKKNNKISERLHLSDDSDLKDALYNKSIEKVKFLSFKNSNVKDQSFKLFK